MKFRALMIDAGPMREFTSIVTTISKLSKECVLRLSEDKIYFIVSEENSGPTPPVLWCEIPQANFFSEYQMIGIDEEHKDIYLGVVSASLAKSLVTLKTAKVLKIKLTKKHCPCLTLDIEMPSSTSQQTRQVTHDIPVVVVPRKLWGDFNEPRIPQPDISIELPPLKQLRTTIDRMRTMASEVIIRASAEGRLTLQIKTDMAKVSTRFRCLTVEAFKGPIDHSDSETESQVNEDLSKICSCRIDAKKFSMFLNADHISHNRATCSIVNKKIAKSAAAEVDKMKMLEERIKAPSIWGRVPCGIRFEDLQDRRYEDAIMLLKKHYLPEELTYKSVKISEEKEGVDEFVHNVRIWMKDKMSIAAVKEGTDKLVGVLIMRIQERKKMFWDTGLGNYGAALMAYRIPAVEEPQELQTQVSSRLNIQPPADDDEDK